MPSDTLVYVPFTPDMLGVVRGFDYQRFGFQPFSHTYTDPQTGVVYHSFIRALIRK